MTSGGAAGARRASSRSILRTRVRGIRVFMIRPPYSAGRADSARHRRSLDCSRAHGQGVAVGALQKAAHSLLTAAAGVRVELQPDSAPKESGLATRPSSLQRRLIIVFIASVS